MQLIGEAIRHQVFGKGVITDWKQNLLTVCFSGEEKTFLYPDAFSKYLVLRNQDKQQAILNTIAQRDETRRTQRQVEDQRAIHRSYLRNLKLSTQGQGVLNLSPAQAEAVWTEGRVSTGTYLSGCSKGEPRIPDKLKANSMCLLTTLPQGQPESERVILGGFMVPDTFQGAKCLDGWIPVHPVYQFRLGEKDRPLFWPCIPTETIPRTWGRTVMKYFTNQAGRTVLRTLRARTPELEDFYTYYCRLNRLDP